MTLWLDPDLQNWTRADKLVDKTMWDGKYQLERRRTGVFHLDCPLPCAWPIPFLGGRSSTGARIPGTDVYKTAILKQNLYDFHHKNGVFISFEVF